MSKDLTAVQDQDIELDRIFGPGAVEEAAQLAIKSKEPNQVVDDGEDAVIDTSQNSEWKTTTPKRSRKGRKKIKDLDPNISPIREVSDDSEV